MDIRRQMTHDVAFHTPAGVMLKTILTAVAGAVVGAVLAVGISVFLGERGKQEARVGAVARLAADIADIEDFLGDARFRDLNTALVERNFDPQQVCPLQPDMAAIVASIEEGPVAFESLDFQPDKLLRPRRQINQDLSLFVDLDGVAGNERQFPSYVEGSAQGRLSHVYFQVWKMFDMFGEIKGDSSLVSQAIGVCTLFREREALSGLIDAAKIELDNVPAR